MIIRPSEGLIGDFKKRYAQWTEEEKVFREAAETARLQEMISMQCARARAISEKAATEPIRVHTKLGEAKCTYASRWAQCGSYGSCSFSESAVFEARTERTVDNNNQSCPHYLNTSVTLRLRDPESGIEAQETAVEFWEGEKPVILIPGIDESIVPEHPKWPDVDQLLTDLEALFSNKS